MPVAGRHVLTIFRVCSDLVQASLDKYLASYNFGEDFASP